jgi:hypothetical protein
MKAVMGIPHSAEKIKGSAISQRFRISRWAMMGVSEMKEERGARQVKE